MAQQRVHHRLTAPRPHTQPTNHLVPRSTHLSLRKAVSHLGTYVLPRLPNLVLIIVPRPTKLSLRKTDSHLGTGRLLVMSHVDSTPRRFGSIRPRAREPGRHSASTLASQLGRHAKSDALCAPRGKSSFGAASRVFQPHPARAWLVWEPSTKFTGTTFCIRGFASRQANSLA